MLKLLNKASLTLVFSALLISLMSPQVYADNTAWVSLSFYKIFVRNASEGTCGGHVGEYEVDITVNGKTKKFKKGVRDNTNYKMNIDYLVKVPRNVPIKVHVNGVEKDGGSILSCSTGDNDYLGEFSRRYTSRNNWGKGYHDVWTSTKHFKLFYKIDVR